MRAQPEGTSVTGEKEVHMRVDAIMSHPVVTVTPDTPLKEVASLLAEKAISGVPVVEGDRVLGIVSESDVIRKEHAPDEEPPHRFGRLRGARRSLVGAVTAGEAMTAPSLTVEPWVSICWAACLMAEHDVNRLPVVDRDRLVGIVARADLVRAFARSDAEVEREIVDEVLPSLSLSPNDVSVTVEHGEVVLAGEVDIEADAAALARSVQRVVGVVRVQSAVRVRIPERIA
jgi:CBS domain-containing protein